MTEQLLHATTVALEGRAVFLRGPSGAGKSDLALRLIDRGWRLVSDDQTAVLRRDGRLVARAPETIAGRIEVRGLGLQSLARLEEAALCLVVDLVGASEVERLPEGDWLDILGDRLPRLAFDPHQASTPIKIELALAGLAVPALESKSDEAVFAEPTAAQSRRLVLVTGLSGAGHSTALKLLEDMRFEAIDNLPLHLLNRVLEGPLERPLAVGIDVRTRHFAARSFLAQLATLRARSDIETWLIFLECDDDTLVRRFAETRRRHPLAEDRPVIDGIAAERRLVAPLREEADLVIATSGLPPAQLRQILAAKLGPEERAGMATFVTSFSFREGLPRAADLVFDVRFLTNPHYEAALRPLTGEAPEIVDFIEADPAFEAFDKHLKALLRHLLPRYEEQGKSYMTIAIGCTGGRHRSVMVACHLAAWLEGEGRAIALNHRDLPKAEGSAAGALWPADRQKAGDLPEKSR